MYKWYFNNKKVVIFDLESSIDSIHVVYLNIFREILDELDFKYEDFFEDNFEELTLVEVYKKVANNVDLKKRIPYQTLYQNFLGKLNNAILDEDYEIYLKDGFYGLIYELKEEQGFTLILKSELSAEITNSFIDRFELKDYFDLIVFQKDMIKPENLYKDILKHIKKYKLKSKDCIAFEGHPYNTFQTANSNILTIGIRTATYYIKDFSYKVNLIIGDFNELVGNLDKTYKEAFLELNPDFATKIEEDKKQK